MRRSWDLLRKKKQNISDKEVSRQQNLRNGGANFRCPPFLLVSVRCFPPSSPWDSVPHPAKGAFLKKRPLEPSKTFWCVKAKPDSSPFHKKYVARPQKKFSDRPLFQKGSPGCRAGSPARSIGQRAGHTRRLKEHDCDGNAVDKPIFLRYTIHCSDVSWNEQSERKVK